MTTNTIEEALKRFDKKFEYRLQEDDKIYHILFDRSSFTPVSDRKIKSFLKKELTTIANKSAKDEVKFLLYAFGEDEPLNTPRGELRKSYQIYLQDRLKTLSNKE